MPDIKTFYAGQCDHLSAIWTGGNYLGKEPELVFCTHRGNLNKYKDGSCNKIACPLPEEKT